ncbi:MAG TPA: hypothetical protein DEF47_03925 [Herpetosiphon sp.]|uniref:Methylthioadenosine phosphorylase n=1 Tax=Herpetosiphon aurantiacus (strain ATCC 23779 / DSM 785 / 114-95) TaxID=316274 RepID=A9B0R0_HERA2|nr:methylthioadenosine phosphorylase [Herpetosiphon sp.]ABX03780.1 methylthioadenosine phosphorylase [Herpetosiphon aurantiacus DSM 785]HBW49039.1 hypothetical protein [Herpetosiphon sp.]
MSFTITSLNTPFGLAMFATKSSAGGSLAILLDEPNPHAAIYAAKSQGVTWIIEAVSMLPCDGLLQPDDILIPDQLVDLTQQRSSTFFRNRGYGFIGQNSVWCPDLRASLLTAAQSISQRVFSRGTLAVGEADTTLEAAQTWQAHGLSRSAAPAAYLAKELELCYAVVGIVGTAASKLGNTLIASVAQHLPTAPTCACRQTMQSARDRGLVGDDWRTWIGE